MWNIEVEKCFTNSSDINYCNSFDNSKGWGCRLIRVIPDYVPKSNRGKAELFSKVYTMAENIGILECPNFVSTSIDDVVENESELRSIIKKK